MEKHRASDRGAMTLSRGRRGFVTVAWLTEPWKSTGDGQRQFLFHIGDVVNTAPRGWITRAAVSAVFFLLTVTTLHRSAWYCRQ
jgi:hypothetical protein